jgi:hypothetical protein
MAPAHYAAHVFGGVCSLARILGKSPGRVSYWLKPRKVGGADGRIPSDDIKVRLLDLAKERGIDLSAEDLLRGREVETVKIDKRH